MLPTPCTTKSGTLRSLSSSFCSTRYVSSFGDPASMSAKFIPSTAIPSWHQLRSRNGSDPRNGSDLVVAQARFSRKNCQTFPQALRSRLRRACLFLLPMESSMRSGVKTFLHTPSNLVVYLYIFKYITIYLFSTLLLPIFEHLSQNQLLEIFRQCVPSQRLKSFSR